MTPCGRTRADGDGGGGAARGACCYVKVMFCFRLGEASGAGPVAPVEAPARLIRAVAAISRRRRRRRAHDAVVRDSRAAHTMVEQRLALRLSAAGFYSARHTPAGGCFPFAGSIEAQQVGLQMAAPASLSFSVLGGKCLDLNSAHLPCPKHML